RGRVPAEAGTVPGLRGGGPGGIQQGGGPRQGGKKTRTAVGTHGINSIERRICADALKKTDVARHTWVPNHVGLLVNGPAAEVRPALHLVIRRTEQDFSQSKVDEGDVALSSAHHRTRQSQRNKQLRFARCASVRTTWICHFFPLLGGIPLRSSSATTSRRLAPYPRSRRIRATAFCSAQHST